MKDNKVMNACDECGIYKAPGAELKEIPAIPKPLFLCPNCISKRFKTDKYLVTVTYFVDAKDVQEIMSCEYRDEKEILSIRIDKDKGVGGSALLGTLKREHGL